MTATIAERVAKGAAFLDEHEPGWDGRIDLGTLDLSAECRCVLGQLNTDLARDWSAILQRYGLVRYWNEGSGPASDAELGFNITSGWLDEAEETTEYDALTAEWRRLIAARRAA